MLIQSQKLRDFFNLNVSSKEVSSVIDKNNLEKLSLKRINKTIKNSNNEEKINKLKSILLQKNKVESIKSNTSSVCQSEEPKNKYYDLTASELSNRYNINVLPVHHNEKFIGYLFQGIDSNRNRLLISTHGTARNHTLTFNKDDDIQLNFAALANTVLSSSTTTFIDKLRQDEIQYKDASQVYDKRQRRVTNYFLSGGIRTQPENAASLVADIHGDKNNLQFDIFLLDNETTGILFSDVISSIRALEPSYKMFDCHFCRPKNNQAKAFSVANNFKTTAPIYQNIRQTVSIVERRPDKTFPQPALWESSTNPGAIGVFIPGNNPKYILATSEVQAQRILREHGIIW
ncbi:TPA: putative adhesin [Vibrio parahaemolyticus]|uniref:putative adhesin n=1 Tax=Vibrio parahaemolyticus TaxID=670 RepID=UPI00320C562E